MNNSLIYLFFAGGLIYFLSFSCIQLKESKEGLMTYKIYFINFEDSSKLPFTQLSNKVWFLDSCFIIEMNRTENQFVGDSLASRSYPFLKYTFFDLKTMLCQDYLFFNEASLPYCSYRLQSKDVLFSNFYKKREEFDSVRNLVQLPDTIIEGKVYKSVKEIKAKGTSYEYEITFFLDCSESSVFSFDRAIEVNYPTCRAVKYCMKPDLKSKTKMCSEYCIDRSSLTASEVKIFNKWIANSRTTKLPILDYSQIPRINDSIFKLR